MSNHLKYQTSPYLLQHAENPVDWYPWGEEAFCKARAEDKPIFLSIGYSTCHWCHVMARESFEDLEIADILSKYYVSPSITIRSMAAFISAAQRTKRCFFTRKSAMTGRSPVETPS